ncbi:MAG TPA: CBS domain-containing protein [Candidatus Levybacteria bacterium]|nr:CBS domain-containing protein [Candidatus Levybacteria bacterium]
MKVKDIECKSSIWVEDTLPVKSLARMIFTANLSGFPVLHGKKLVGFVTEEDIFSKIYNGEKDSYSQDVVSKMLEMPTKDIMVKNVVSVTPDTNIVDAQLIMQKHNYTRLPIVNNRNEFLGLITRGDIFREILKDQIEQLEKDQYATFIADNYDKTVDWDKRFDYEFPTLFRVFNRHGVKKILDLGVWTGEYSIALAKEGLEVIGIDHNSLMIKKANEKLRSLPEKVSSKVQFKLSDFTDIPDIIKEKVDAVICMGNSFPYIPNDLEKTIEDSKKVLRKDGVLVLQVLNMKKVIKKQRRLLSFHIETAKIAGQENLNLEFFDEGKDNKLIHNVIIFHSNGKAWSYKGISSISIKFIDKDEIEKMLKKLGFKDISITGNMGDYQGEFGQMSLVKPYDPNYSDWMTVVARV